MFRYERPQKGRFREFQQVSLECIGSASVAQDAQLIVMLDRLFNQVFHMQSYALHINFLGTPEERAAFRETFAQFLEGQSGLCETCVVRKSTNILRIFDCKQEACRAICKIAPTLETVFGQTSKSEWQQLKNYLEELSVSFTVNTRLVRGLDYYNKTVFEFVSTELGSQSAFCGGGRYDFLVSHIGGKEDQPSVGAAIGIDRLLMLLENQQDSLPIAQEPALYVIVPVAAWQHGIALQIADFLFESGLTVETLFDGSLKSMMRKANKLGAKFCIVVGQAEQEQGTVILKDMKSGDEQTVKQTDLPKILK
jgi:histidyl-tRNA synthetase